MNLKTLFGVEYFSKVIGNLELSSFLVVISIFGEGVTNTHICLEYTYYRNYLYRYCIDLYIMYISLFSVLSTFGFIAQGYINYILNGQIVR